MPFFSFCFRLPEHAGVHAALSAAPPGLRRHATSFPDAAHDVRAACRSVARDVGTMPTRPPTKTSLTLPLSFVFTCSRASHGAPPPHRSHGCRRPRARSPSVQVRRRSPQHAAAHQRSATGQHAAGSATCRDFFLHITHRKY